MTIWIIYACNLQLWFAAPIAKIEEAYRSAEKLGGFLSLAQVLMMGGEQ